VSSNKPVDRKTLHQQAKHIFSTPAGESVLAYLRGRAFMNSSSFSTDRGRTEFNEGKRAHQLEIENLLDETRFVEEQS
jgi:hypothetical protein